MADITRLPKPLAVHWEWQVRAACRGMDTATFFHPPNERDAAREARIAQAKAVCRRCPAIDDCLDHALRVREPYGSGVGCPRTSEPACLVSNRCVTPKPWA